MKINNEVISKLADAAIDGKEELRRLKLKCKELHQELLLTYVQMRVIETYLGHNLDKILFRCYDRVQIGDDKIDISCEDVDSLKTLPYVKVDNDDSLSIELLKKNI